MSGETSSAGDVFDPQKIRRLIELMNEHELSEIDLKQGSTRIRLRRGLEQVVTRAAAPLAAVAPPPAHNPTGAQPADAATSEGFAEIKSPMVGTFYASPNPESAHFVKVGDHVSDETTVCIIEAMKVFNEIAAEVSGQIVATLVENGDPVEYGQPLFRVSVGK